MVEHPVEQQPSFLTAEWRRLVMISYPIDPAILHPHLPRGTELDSWQGMTFISLVGFRFLRTRIKGLAVPLHENFDEINLRFYVRSPGPEGWRRGVVFVREVVPRQAIAAVARWLYNEKYVACPTRSASVDPSGATPGRAEYAWKHEGEWLSIGARFSGRPGLPEKGSLEEFIAEHYWGYTRQRDGGTLEYRVEHPPWEVWRADETILAGDLAGFYGERFAGALAACPRSAIVADGSAVSVMRGAKFEERPARRPDRQGAAGGAG